MREDGRRKDADLIKIRQTLDSTMAALKISNRQHTQLQVQHNEGFQSLASPQAQVRRLNSEEVASTAVA